MEVVGTWDESLIMCPSQCYLKIKYNGKFYVLYLRWRWSDPWTANLIETGADFRTTGGRWSRNLFLNEEKNIMDFFTEKQLKQCKATAIKRASNFLREDSQ